MNWPIILVLAMTQISCSINQLAVKASSGLLYEAAFDAERDDSFERFAQTLPSQLKLVESLLSMDPENEALLATVTKGYSAIGYGIHETLFLEDLYAEKDNSVHKENALKSYTRSFRTYLKLLKSNGLTYQELLKTGDSGKITELLGDKLSSSLEMREASVYGALSLLSMINLQKDRVSLLTSVPVAKGIYDFACKEDPEIANGVCYLLEGSYLASRPKMLGGDPEKGKEILLLAIKKRPENWLSRVTLLQFHSIPQMDEDEYAKQKPELLKAEKEHRDSLIWSPTEDEVSLTNVTRLRLFQVIALKRFEIIKKYEEDLF